MKLYATLETSRGKTVSVSDNESITATVYDGNMKAYSVTIEWCNVGDPEHWKCDKCGNECEGVGFANEKPEKCEECNGTAFTLVPPTMGALVTTREWRNREQTNDKYRDICQFCGKKADYINDESNDLYCSHCEMYKN